MSLISKEVLSSIPSFDSMEEVELWFSIFESSMFIHKIVEEETKYHLLICLIPPKVNSCTTCLTCLKCLACNLIIYLIPPKLNSCPTCLSGLTCLTHYLFTAKYHMPDFSKGN